MEELEELPNGYILEKSKILGEGTFGIVYQGYHVKTPNEKIAIKEQKLNREMLEVELRIIEQTQLLKNPNLLEIFDHYVDDRVKDAEYVYFMMEKCDGGSLSRYIAQRKGKISTLDIYDILLQLSNGLEGLHSVKIIHRDLKPENILCSNGV